MLNKHIELKGHNSPIYTLTNGFLENSFLSGSGDKIVAQWGFDSGRFENFSVKLPGVVYSILVTHDQSFLLIGTASGSLHIIDTRLKKEIKYFQFNKGGIFKIIALKAKNSIVLSTVNGVLIELDLDSYLIQKEVSVSNSKIRCICSDEQNDKLYVSDGTGFFHVYELSTFRLLTSILAHQQSCNVVRLHPEQALLITGGKDAYLNVFDLMSFKKVKSIPAHNYAIYDICFLKGTDFFATASRDKTIKLWNSTNIDFLLRINKENHQGHTHSVNALCWNEQFKLLASAGDDRKIILWELLE